MPGITGTLLDDAFEIEAVFGAPPVLNDLPFNSYYPAAEAVVVAGGDGGAGVPFFHFYPPNMPWTVRRAFKSWELPKEQKPRKLPRKSPRKLQPVGVSEVQYTAPDKATILTVRGVVRRHDPKPVLPREVQSEISIEPALRFLNTHIDSIRNHVEGQRFAARLEALGVEVRKATEQVRLYRLREADDELIVLGLL